MQHDDISNGQPVIGLMEPLPPPRVPLPPVTIRALGVQMELEVTPDQYLRDDSHWRLRAIYEPALCAQSLAAQGVAVDVGAGYGCFALPFATAFPGWTIWAFEPEPNAFAVLCQNIRRLGLANVIPVNAAVVGDVACDPAAAAALAALAHSAPGESSGQLALKAVLPVQDFRQHVEMQGILERQSMLHADFVPRAFPAVPSPLLASLGPRLLKLTAPFIENAVLEGLRHVPLDHVIGEAWTHVSADLVHGPAAGQRQTWLPRAGDPLLRLRRSKPLTGLTTGLDVVVAMYNSRGWIKECVDGILQDGHPEIRALVVDDGSTDGSGDLVAELYAGNDRVVLLRKPNGGCASARNYGRMHSNAGHITFVDADDVPGPGLFTGLLELARHTGAELVQGGFELLVGDERHPSYEGGIPEFIHARRHNLGERTCHLVPSWLLMQGQPTIWRRIYRRDFLDNRAIHFPEHIRAFDDQIFQVLTLQNVANVPVLDGVAYGYRQHPGQDIKQGDQRSFYSLEMFRLIVKRGLAEGWNEFGPVLRSYVNTVNWCWKGLRPDLRPAFVRGAAELWVYACHALGPDAVPDLGPHPFAPPDFAHYVDLIQTKLAGLPPSHGLIFLDSVDMHVSMVAPPRST